MTNRRPVYFYSLALRPSQAVMRIPGCSQKQVLPCMSFSCPLPDSNIPSLTITVPVCSLADALQQFKTEAATVREPTIVRLDALPLPMISGATHNPCGQVMRLGRLTLAADVHNQHLHRGSDIARFVVTEKPEPYACVLADVTMPLTALLRWTRTATKKSSTRGRVAPRKTPMAIAIFEYQRLLHWLRPHEVRSS